MRLRIRSTNFTPFGLTSSLLGSGLLAVAAFRATWKMSSNFPLAWWTAAAVFMGALIAGQLLVNVREFTFNAASRTLIVRDRWLMFIRRRPKSIEFADILAVYLRSQESVYPVIVLRSGKKLYPRWPGTVREINRYCAAVKRITHVGRISVSEQRSRGRAGRLLSILTLTAAVLMMTAVVVARSLPHAINLAVNISFVLLVLIVFGIAVWTNRGRRLGTKETLQEARTGICPRCGVAAAAKGSRCPACGLRL